MKALQLFSVRRIVRTREGRRLSIFMDLFEIKKPQKGLFLECYRLSWIAFDLDNPEQKILVDAHSPIGFHVHTDDEKAVPLSVRTLEEALNVFKELVERKFGELEENIL